MRTPITQDLPRLAQAIAVMKGNTEGLRHLATDLDTFETTEAFRESGSPKLSTIIEGLETYLSTLELAEQECDPNSPMRQQQASEFSQALGDLFPGFTF